ncbi:Methylmalonyl-CoA mutase small subunit [Pseudovibrio axinellae]|uniref:Methylmalonyl-CoA mutase small subunit n=1 Tax=Pseudovibrio axinellae TaxID=989403 RepID=A0A166ADS1_9HYPH|nr:methylmalonyl-CoA mutase family protein [Pseudovibrio axinellae]KZL20937.1 Methylmalonyl-CoA mutase small subunit [Pseudovibrio axinellae]SEP82315.1 heterodimeric methylmalonyl-CoA mutase small subunit [Pseudovibrio axinellae]
MHNIDFPTDFLKATQNDWEVSALRALKGAALDALKTPVSDGLEIKPLYQGHPDSAPLQLRERSRPWKIIQRCDHPDIFKANAQMLEDLEGGADGLELVLPASPRVLDGGLNVNRVVDLLKLLEGVKPDLIDFRLECGYEGSATLALLVESCNRMGVRPDQLTVHGVSDPLSVLVSTGRVRDTFERLQLRTQDLVGYVRNNDIRGSLLRSDGRCYHEAGATTAQELGLTLSSLLFYMRTIESGGVPSENISNYVSACLSASADQFDTIIKARAMRQLWSRLLDAAQLPAQPLYLHMETSWRMMTKRDPWVNMLRTTVAAFAAGVGGADSVTVLPFTLPLGLPNAFARRIARNTQLILIEESNLAQVSDPAAGSGLVEERTEELANAAWSYFQKVEKEGGLPNALFSGLISSDITTARKDEERLVATGRHPMTGTSAFPNLDEKAVEVLQVNPNDIAEIATRLDLAEPSIQGHLIEAVASALRDGAGLVDIQASRTPLGSTECVPLKCSRLSAPFEKLRDQADAFSQSQGKPPKVFLATCGPVAHHTARAAFASNFYAAGGFISTGAVHFENLEDLIASFRVSEAKVACICSSDTIYDEQALEVLKELKDAGAVRVTVAGRPKDLLRTLSENGLDAPIYQGCDMLAELKKCFEVVGVSPAV